jgi:hypothetical protein
MFHPIEKRYEYALVKLFRSKQQLSLSTCIKKKSWCLGFGRGEELRVEEDDKERP